MNMMLNKIRTFIKGIKMPKIKLPKIPKITLKKPDLTKVKSKFVKILPVLNKGYRVIIKIVKSFFSWLIKAIKESIAQLWTLLGFFIAWLTLTGTAQQVVGLATIICTSVWLITIPLREEKE
jgi:hypothetical protein